MININKYILKRVLLFLFLSGGLQQCFSQSLRLSEVHFTGLKHTKPAYLLQFIHSKPGELLDSPVIHSDVQALQNLRLFSEVSYTVEIGEQGAVINFILKEVWTLIPHMDIGFIKDNWKLQAGVTEYNFLGYGYNIGGYYRYYGRNSVAFFADFPYLVYKRYGLSADMARNATIEPVYTREIPVFYNMDSWSASGSLRIDKKLGNTLSVGGGYLLERYKETRAIAGGMEGITEKQKLIFKGTYKFNRLNYNRQQIRGIANEFSVESATLLTEERTILTFIEELLFFLEPYKSGNIAARVRFGLCKDAEGPFYPFVQDSYINLRGSGNRIARGTGELTINAEYRQTVFDKPAVAVQLVAFTDLSTLRPVSDPSVVFFDKENHKTFYGGGLRFYIIKFNNLFLRGDYGINADNAKERGIVLGIGQYF